MEPLWLKLFTAFSSAVLGVAGVVVALFVFFKGRGEFQKSQQWKEAEFIAQEIKQMQSSQHHRAVTSMLDWEDRPIAVPGTAGRPAAGFVVNSEWLGLALLSHRRVRKFGDAAKCVRDIFSDFFDDWNRLGHYLETGLVKPATLRPHIGYWVDLIAGRGAVKKKSAVRFAIYEFVIDYGYTGVLFLFARFDFEMEKEYARLRDELKHPALPDRPGAKLPPESRISVEDPPAATA